MTRRKPWSSSSGRSASSRRPQSVSSSSRCSSALYKRDASKQFKHLQDSMGAFKRALGTMKAAQQRHLDSSKAASAAAQVLHGGGGGGGGVDEVPPVLCGGPAASCASAHHQGPPRLPLLCSLSTGAAARRAGPAVHRRRPSPRRARHTAALRWHLCASAELYASRPMLRGAAL